MSEPQRTTASMRRGLFAASLLVAIVGVQLFVFGERTRVAFAFTIDPPITAAFLGANYWSSVLLEWISSREDRWVDARAAVPGVLIFTALTLAQTVQNIVYFRLDSPFGWAWIVVYATAPFVFGWLWWKQREVAGDEPPRGAPLSTWLRATLLLHAIVLLVLGVALFFGHEGVTNAWPWSLDPRGPYKSSLGPYVGCWLLGIGTIAAQAWWENDLRRLRGAFASYTLLGALQIVTLARYRTTFQWSTRGGMLFVAFVASALVVGLVGGATARTARD